VLAFNEVDETRNKRNHNFIISPKLRAPALLRLSGLLILVKESKVRKLFTFPFFPSSPKARNKTFFHESFFIRRKKEKFMIIITVFNNILLQIFIVVSLIIFSSLNELKSLEEGRKSFSLGFRMKIVARYL
jgi:hypothetical protein